MDRQRKRRLVRFLRWAEPFVDVIGLAAIGVFFYRFLPEEPLRLGPATGGDMGSHFWPLYTLVEWGIPNRILRVWNPGNLGGEPHLVHYFPFPFYLMAVFAQFIPLGEAFSLGTLIPMFVMPFAAYLSVRGLGLRFPAPILSASLILCFLYNESYTMFGGNTLSTLAGQFAHTLAISLYLLGVGALCWEIRRDRPPVLSLMLFATVALTHAYVELVVPFALLAISLFYPRSTRKRCFLSAAASGLGSVLLSLWFLVAMVTNQRWTTAVPMSWKNDPHLLAQLFPRMMYPVFALFIALLPQELIHSSLRRRRRSSRRLHLGEIALLALPPLICLLTTLALFAWGHATLSGKNSQSPEKLLFLRGTPDPSLSAFTGTFVVLLAWALFLSPTSIRHRPSELRFLSIWLIPGLACVGYFGIFTEVGLVDIRAIPQLQAFIAIAAALLLARILNAVGRLFSWVVTPVLLVLSLAWVDAHVENFPHWLEWNYSGWTTKPLYKDLRELTDSLRGSFSDPRVVYEHSAANEPTGTMRVFEMLPYFANRSTLEGVYLQSTILAPAVFTVQAEVSKTPSCPILGTYCPRPNLLTAEPHLRLMGVSELILVSPELLEQAHATPYLKKERTIGQWTTFRLRDPPKLVEVLREPPVVISPDRALDGITAEDALAIHEKVGEMKSPPWMRRFYLWFRSYNGTQPFLVLRDKNMVKLESEIEKRGDAGAGLWDTDGTCTPSVTVGINTLTLRTPCPGRAHLLKFAYHSSWKTDSGDPLFLISPGFLALIPSRSEVTLTFGQDPIWRVADMLSFTFVLLLLLFVIGRFIRSSVRGRCRSGAFGAAASLLIMAFLVPDSAAASYIRILGHSQLEFSVQGDELLISGTYGMENKGDEQARGVFPHFILGGWSWVGDEKRLEPNGRESWSLNERVPLKLLGCDKDPSCSGLTLPVFGSHPLFIRRYYQSANGYRYTAVEVLPVTVGELQGEALVAARAPSISGILEITGDGQRFTGHLTVLGTAHAEKMIAVSTVIPQEIRVLSEPSTIVMPVKGRTNARFELENVTALPGSTYAVFAVLQWEDHGIRVTSVASAAAEIKRSEKSRFPWLPVVVVLALSLFLLYLFVFRRG